MVVDEPGRLHEGVADRGSHEREAAPREVTAERARHRSLGRHSAGRAGTALDGRSSDEGPEIGGEAAVLALHREEGTGIGDGAPDLARMPDDAGITLEPHDVPRREGR